MSGKGILCPVLNMNRQGVVQTTGIWQECTQMITSL